MSLQETSSGATLGGEKKKKGKSGYFKAEKRDSIRIGVSDVCSGGAAENQPLQHFPLLHPTLQSS